MRDIYSLLIHCICLLFIRHNHILHLRCCTYFSFMLRTAFLTLHLFFIYAPYLFLIYVLHLFFIHTLQSLFMHQSLSLEYFQPVYLFRIYQNKHTIFRKLLFIHHTYLLFMHCIFLLFIYHIYGFMLTSLSFHLFRY